VKSVLAGVSQRFAAVYDVETDQIVNGDGVAPNMLGILKTPGLAD
jgi:hypothetical protein